jgi:hypothetical protein
MSARQYTWQADAIGSYALWCAAKREQAIREGRIAPETDTERQWAALGPVPVQQLQAGRR